MFMNFLLCIVGIAALVYSADKVVEAASNLAINFKVSKMVIGLSIVAVGTSLPELVVSLNSSIKGNSALSLGNIVGSNIMNIALILGISAIILPINSTQELVKREIPILISSTALFWIFARTDSTISPNEGLILIAIFITYNLTIYILGKKEGKLSDEYSEEAEKYIINQATPVEVQTEAEPQAEAKTAANDNEEENQESDSKKENTNSKKTSIAFNILCIIGGFVGLVVGSELLVKGATTLALLLGMSNEIIGLTLVAIGTSLPELITSVLASKKGQSEISVGNVLGSNIFNITAIIGIVAILPYFSGDQNLNLSLTVSPEMLSLHIPVMMVLSVVLLPIMLTNMQITRREGAFFLVIYICYTIMLIQNTFPDKETNNEATQMTQEQTTHNSAAPASLPISLPNK